MEDKNKDFTPEHDFLAEEPPLAEEFDSQMPELDLLAGKTDRIPVEEVQTAQSGAPAFQLTEETLVSSGPENIYEAEEPAPAVPQLTTDLPPVLEEAAPEPEVPSFAHDFLSPQVPEQEIMADESAMSAYDMTHPSEQAEAFPDEAFRPSGEEAPEFQASFQPAPPQPEAPAESRPRPARKGRPKRKKGAGLFGIPHLLATAVWLVIILAIGVSLGRMIWVCAADVLAFGRESNKVSVTITANDTIGDIADKLHEAGLVRYPGLFKLYASIAVDDGEITTGTFELDTLYDYHALVVQMSSRSSSRTVVEDVLIPEGYSCRQIFALLEEKGICTVAELEEYAANGEFQDFWFLEDVERGDKYCLEGFLFPDTYDFYSGSTPREALGKMLLGFQARIDQETVTTQLAALNERLSTMMRSKGCSEEHIAEHQLSLRDLLTVASLIEEETAGASESPTIASVIFNRLTEDQVYERYLNIDASIIYVTGSASNIDTSLDDPYNTYKYAGLTPGPITNPGLDSINAALDFADTSYYYYVLNPETGMHQFSKTLEEHEKWVEEFKSYQPAEQEDTQEGETQE